MGRDYDRDRYGRRYYEEEDRESRYSSGYRGSELDQGRFVTEREGTYRDPSESSSWGREYDREGEFGRGRGATVSESRAGQRYSPYSRSAEYNYGQPYRPERYSGSREVEEGYGGRRYRERDEDRGWFERATDEVASWFGDDEAERRRRLDRIRSEGHRGRGPKGYRRSDDRIKEDINDRLTDSYYLDASDIEVEVTHTEVVLTGAVDSRYAKRLAEDIAEGVSGVTNVENRLRVKGAPSSETSSRAQELAESGTGATAATTSGTRF